MYLMTSGRQDKGMTSGGWYQAAVQFLDLLKPVSLVGHRHRVLIYKGWILSRKRIACVLGHGSLSAAYFCSPLTPSLYPLISHWGWPSGSREKTREQGSKVTVFPTASLCGRPCVSHNNLFISTFFYAIPLPGFLSTPPPFA